LILVIIDVPIAISMGVASAAFLVSSAGSIPVIAQRIYGGIDSFTLLAVPFFILAGNLSNTGGITRRIFRFSTCLVGHITGGLGLVNVLASMIFAGMSGSTNADTAGLGRMEIEAMKEAGFDLDFSIGITCASATLGPIIPPSITMVVFATLANCSVGALFLGGLLPGLLVGLCLMIMVYLIAKKRGYPRQPRATLHEIWASFRESFLALITPVIILGGILFGIFTPTEAAIVASVYALILGVLVYRELKITDIYEILRETIRSTSIVVFIVGVASLFGWVITVQQIPQQVAIAITNIAHSRTFLLLLVNVLLLVLGCFMEAIAAMTLVVPVLMPVLSAYGVSPIHFGLIVAVNLLIGTLTPPMGTNLFVAADIVKWPLEKVTKAVMPFWIPLVVALLLITYCPAIVEWVPSLVLGS
jgi:tripartite ATP-independent transporter DctM subunit